MYVCMYVCMYICMYVCMYVHIPYREVGDKLRIRSIFIMLFARHLNHLTSGQMVIIYIYNHMIIKETNI